MTSGVELIGDIGQTNLTVLDIKTRINDIIRDVGAAIRNADPHTDAQHTEMVRRLGLLINYIRSTGQDLDTLTKNLNIVSRFQTGVMHNIGERGEDPNQWKHLVYGKQDNLHKSDFVTVAPPQGKVVQQDQRARLKVMDITGVGAGDGDDYDDIGYYRDISDAMNPASPTVSTQLQPGIPQVRQYQDPSEYELPNRPGASPFETRIAMVSQTYMPVSKTIREDYPASTWTNEARNVQSRGRPPDAKGHVGRKKYDQGNYNSKDSRGYESLQGLGKLYAPSKAGGGESYIFQEEELLNFRDGPGSNSQGLADLGFSFPKIGGISLPKIPGLPKLPGLPELPKLPDVGDLVGKGMDAVKWVISSLVGKRNSLLALAKRASTQAMGYAQKGLKQSWNRIKSIETRAINTAKALNNQIKKLSSNALSYAKKYANKAYQLAKKETKAAIGTAITPIKTAIKSTIDEFKFFRNIVIGGLGILTIGVVIAIVK